MNLAVLKNCQNGKEMGISSLPFVIGRSRSADFIIANVTVSRNHCQIVKVGSSWKVNDYSSSGTYVNDALVGKSKSVDLNNGDSIRLGPVESNLSWSFYFDIINENSSDSEAQKETVLNSACENSDSKDCLTDSRENKVTDKKLSLCSVEDEKTENERIQELTKELQEVQKALNDLKEKNSTLQKSASVIVNQSCTSSTSHLLENLADLMESEFQCSICSELFVMAVTLGCTHTFCLFCINQWKKKQKTCPICRKKITRETRSLVVDNYIDKMVGNLSVELKNRRDAIIKERNQNEPHKKKFKI